MTQREIPPTSSSSSTSWTSWQPPSLPWSFSFREMVFCHNSWQEDSEEEKSEDGGTSHLRSFPFCFLASTQFLVIPLRALLLCFFALFVALYRFLVDDGDSDRILSEYTKYFFFFSLWFLAFCFVCWDEIPIIVRLFVATDSRVALRLLLLLLLLLLMLMLLLLLINPSFDSRFST